MRLTNEMRNEVVSMAIAHAFDARYAELSERETVLAVAVYENKFPKVERDAAYAMPAHWFDKRHYIHANAGGYRVQLSIPKEVEPFRFPDYHDTYSGISNAGLSDRVQKFAQEKANIETEKADLKRSLTVKLALISTLAKLKEMWPEGSQFYEHIEKREVPKLPALRFDEINVKLGVS